MKITVTWTLNHTMAVVAIAIDPVHDCFIAGVGKRIYLYKVVFNDQEKKEETKEVKQMEKHTADITCLSFRKDGNFFASGARDNIVYLWDMSNLDKPSSKISFNDGIIRLSYNPCYMILLAMSKSTMSVVLEKTVQKYSLSSGVDCAWTNDGNKYAIAYENGTISIRDKENDKNERVLVVNEQSIEKISCICFSNTRFFNKNEEYALYVCTWEKKFHVMDVFNEQVQDTRRLTADPISIALYKDDYVIVGTNNRELNFFTKEGIFITTITEGLSSWVTSVRNFDKYNSIISCSNDGSIIKHHITFQIVHGIYNERYVYRKNLREIVVHDLLTNEKTTIVTKWYIRKLAVFKDFVAALTSDNKIHVHSVSADDNAVPNYFVKWEGNLSLMLLASHHLIVCKENHVYLYYLGDDVALIENVKRDWSFETDVKYLRVLGGAMKREGVLCGLRSGEVYIIYLDNQFPVLIYTNDIPVRSLDINPTRSLLAIINDNFELSLIELKTKRVLWCNEKAKSIAFNSDIENMISYWYEGNVYIRTSDFPPISEKMTGVIIGFRGTKVFILHSFNNVNVLDISNSQSIMKYAERREMEKAYEIACLGATDQEWIYLGFEALLNFDFKVAADCFKKVEDIRLINLVFDLEQERQSGINEDIIKGDIYSQIGKYNEAAQCYIQGGNPGKAQEMYATLKMYAEAMEIKAKYMQGGDNEFTDEMLKQQAEWLAENKKFKEAGDLYIAIGKKKEGIEIYGEHGLLDSLIELCRGFTKEQNSDLISLCGEYFKKYNNYSYAAEAYLKLGDQKSLVYMNVELKKWNEAFILAREHKQLNEYVHLQFAEQLVLEDKFKEAQESYRKADRVDLSMKLLNKLINNAVYEKRYKDASLLFVSYASDALACIKEFKRDATQLTKAEYKALKEYKDSDDLVDMFNAYDLIYKYIEEPFSCDVIALNELDLFNASRFIINKFDSFKTTTNPQYKSILPSYVYYCLGNLAKKFECYKTARYSYEKLSSLNYPLSWTDAIDLEIMNIRSKPYVDKDTEMPICYNCLHTNPLFNVLGDQCTVCCAPFVRCSLSYEVLPLVQFKPNDNISADQAIDMIKMSSMERLKKSMLGVEKGGQGVNVLRIEGGGEENADVFEMKLNQLMLKQGSAETYEMLELGEEELKSLPENEVFFVDKREVCRTAPVKFYKKRKKEVDMVLCKFCFKFFKLENFENAFLKAGNCCPLCKNVDDTLRAPGAIG